MLDVQTIVVGNAAVVTALIGGLGFFIRMWINGVNDRLDTIEEKMERRVTDERCRERMATHERDINNLGASVRDLERGV